jgi:hypothetical protein
MISRRDRDHARFALLPREGGDGVVGAAKLERAGALQGLAFQENAGAGRIVEGRARHQRRVHGMAGDALGGTMDVVNGRHGCFRHPEKPGQLTKCGLSH